MFLPFALSWLTFLPLAGGIAILFTRSEDARAHRVLATAFSALTFVLSLWMIPHFNSATADMQFLEKTSWISSFNVSYHMGVDGLSFPLVLLTTLLTLASKSSASCFFCSAVFKVRIYAPIKRFSYTVNSGKILRPSGQYANPMRTIS